MKFLIVDTYYPKFLTSVYSRNPGLSAECYGEQKAFILKQSFGTADFYSKNLRKLGHEAEDVIANADTLQGTWARENGLRSDGKFLLTKVKKMFGFRRLYTPANNQQLKILTEQVKRLRPDILYFQDLSLCPPSLFSDMRKHARLIAGQIACPLPRDTYLSSYDIILTSLPHYVEIFRKKGIKSEYLKIAFEPDILNSIGAHERIYDCTFVGGFSPAHGRGNSILEEVSRRIRIEFFGYGSESLPPYSPILRSHHGEVWGIDMYRVLSQSKISINRHIDIAEDNANNMRLYEATGCGAMLISDFKKNLNKLFVIGKEVESYKDADDLYEKIVYYTKHDVEGATIAKEGQKRTLREHTYFHRMEELVEIIKKYI